MVKTLLANGCIDKEKATHLTTYKGVPPRYYGLPKVHNSGLPLRPIVSCINSPTQEVAKFIASKAFNNYRIFRVKESFDFAERVGDRLPEGFVLASLDIQSLFSNIPAYLVTSVIEDNFFRVAEVTYIPEDIFTYDGKFYKQVSGVPMGGSIRPVLADFIISKLIYLVLENLDFPPPIMLQYVDDTIS